jgi:L-alanine-DL-glutamate epimerase-like enolase superfamily enzyme
MARGFTESRWIAHEAEQKGVSIASHSVEHLYLHLVPAFRDAAFVAESHGDAGWHPLCHAIYRGGMEVRVRMVHLSEAPGFGLEIDWRGVEKFRA